MDVNQYSEKALAFDKTIYSISAPSTAPARLFSAFISNFDRLDFAYMQPKCKQCCQYGGGQLSKTTHIALILDADSNTKSRCEGFSSFHSRVYPFAEG